MIRQGLFLEDLSIGMSRERTHRVVEADITAFAEVTGDHNPLHLDEAYAQTTQFKGRIAHGMLGAGYLSAILGMDLPGPGAIYVSQSLTFKRPVRIGDVVVARAVVAAIDLERARARLKTECLVDGKTVIEGEAQVLVPRRPAPQPGEV
jgi:3-hydroxybutyryl-CoA dehydratase